MRLMTILGLLLVVASLASAQPTGSQGCSLLVVDAKLKKSVCVCNATYCDELVFEWPQNAGDAVLVQSTKGGLRFHASKLDDDNNRPSRGDSQKIELTRLSVGQDGERQSILGFGGAFTDAAGYNVKSVPEGLRKKIMESYFGEHGSQYTFGRVVIGGADFSTRAYSYDDKPGNGEDFNLTHWSLAPEDYRYKIPLIKEAVELVGRYNSSLSLYGSSWSPPAWMKTSKSLVRGHLIDDHRVYESYAQYLVRFYEAYKKEGISFWGGTVQNEPYSANGHGYNFNSLQLSSTEAIKFIANYLGPALAAKGYTKENFKLMVHDDNIDSIFKRAIAIIADKKVQRYVAGLAFHWYNNGRVPYDVLKKSHDKVKGQIEFMMSTEACAVGDDGGLKPVDLGSWDRGERYADDIIEGLNRYSSGWVDWNLVLDQRGAPNWVRNYVDAAVIISDDKSKFYKQPMYYALAHFSRFFRPNSVVIQVNNENSLKDGQLLIAGVMKKDTGHVVLNILNKSDEDKLIEVELPHPKRFTVKAKSLNTFVAKL